VKVVVDTNVLVSALVFPGGVPEQVYRLVIEGGIMLVASPPLRAADDPDDDRVLEAARTAGAGFIVSGDRHLLSLGRWGEVAILGPAEFLAALDPE
jgi:predicted nucleic acid-binding protein